MSLHSLDELNTLVTAAIVRAEHALAGTPEAENAYREVSDLEERLARLIAVDELEGALARVGAVEAALQSGDWLRAARLADVFAQDAPEDVAEQLRALAEDADAAARQVVEPDVRPIWFGIKAA